MAKACTKKTIRIKSKRGKVIAEFVGHTGAGCPPRRKPSTRHLAPWKAVMKKAAPQCKRAAGGNVKRFRACISQAFKSNRLER